MGSVPCSRPSLIPESFHAHAFTTFLGGGRRFLCPFESRCSTGDRRERVHRRNHLQRHRPGRVLRTWRSRCEGHCRREEGRQGRQLRHLHRRYDVEGRARRVLQARRNRLGCSCCCSRTSPRSGARPCSDGAQDRPGQPSASAGTRAALRSRADRRSGGDNVQRNRQFGQGRGQRSHRRHCEVQGRDVFTLCAPQRQLLRTRRRGAVADDLTEETAASRPATF